MAIAFYPQMGCALFGSEATATKVGMGYAIDGNLLSDQEMAQLASTGNRAAHTSPSPHHLTTHHSPPVPLTSTTHTHRRLPRSRTPMTALEQAPLRSSAYPVHSADPSPERVSAGNTPPACAQFSASAAPVCKAEFMDYSQERVWEESGADRRRSVDKATMKKARDSLGRMEQLRELDPTGDSPEGMRPPSGGVAGCIRRSLTARTRQPRQAEFGEESGYDSNPSSHAGLAYQGGGGGGGGNCYSSDSQHSGSMYSPGNSSHGPSPSAGRRGKKSGGGILSRALGSRGGSGGGGGGGFDDDDPLDAPRRGPRVGTDNQDDFTHGIRSSKPSPPYGANAPMGAHKAGRRPPLGADSGLTALRPQGPDPLGDDD